MESLAIWQYYLTVLGDNVNGINFEYAREVGEKRTRLLALSNSKRDCIDYLPKNEVNLLDQYRTSMYTDNPEDER